MLACFTALLQAESPVRLSHLFLCQSDGGAVASPLPTLSSALSVDVRAAVESIEADIASRVNSAVPVAPQPAAQPVDLRAEINRIKATAAEGKAPAAQVHKVRSHPVLACSAVYRVVV